MPPEINSFLELAAHIATVIGVPLGILAILYNALQLRHRARIAKGQFLLQLENMLAAHREVHMKLRPGGVWAKDGAGPETVEEWDAVENYMAFFEHGEILLQQRSIDLPSFQSLFGFRVRSILDNERIVREKLIAETHYWTQFRRLVERLGLGDRVQSEGN